MRRPDSAASFGQAALDVTHARIELEAIEDVGGEGAEAAGRLARELEGVQAELAALSEGPSARRAAA